jgi:hypothetical protein
VEGCQVLDRHCFIDTSSRSFPIPLHFESSQISIITALPVSLTTSPYIQDTLTFHSQVPACRLHTNTMSFERPLRGGCQCGRNRYIIQMPHDANDIARVLFNEQPSHRKRSLSSSRLADLKQLITVYSGANHVVSHLQVSPRHLHLPHFSGCLSNGTRARPSPSFPTRRMP